jgi:hypothetical protein
VASQEPVRFEMRGPVAWLTLNRPAAVNALSPKLLDALSEALTIRSGSPRSGRPQPRQAEHFLGGSARLGDGLQDTRRGACSDGAYRGSAPPAGTDYLVAGVERQAGYARSMR